MKKEIKKQEKVKFDEKEFGDFIHSMMDGFDKEHLENPMFKHFFENIEYFEDPDKMNTMILHPIHSIIKLVLKKKFNKSDEVARLYFNYDFLESNVSELCSKLYGTGCSVDKGRSLVKAYIRWKEIGKMPKFDWKGEYVFHYPETGTEEQWMNFIFGLTRLKYGYNKEYLLALKELMYAKKTKEVITREKKDLEEYKKKHASKTVNTAGEKKK